MKTTALLYKIHLHTSGLCPFCKLAGEQCPACVNLAEEASRNLLTAIMEGQKEPDWLSMPKATNFYRKHIAIYMN